MANFVLGTQIETTENTIDVTVTATAPIPIGAHRFQLVVVDEAGNPSAPAVGEVVIKDTINPTAVLTIAPTQVEFGRPFKLDGSKSSDVAPGTVAKYIWTMLS